MNDFFTTQSTNQVSGICINYWAQIHKLMYNKTSYHV